MKNINRFITNKINIKKNLNYSLIIGLTPSKGARSPTLWNKVYKKNKSRIRMYPADVEKKKLKNFIEFLKKDSLFLGGSITAPYKVDMIKFCDTINPDAKKIGSINTIVKRNQKLVGYNTDYFGALSTLKKIKYKKKILIFGCGGASKAVILAIVKYFKNSNLTLYNRNKKKLSNFLKKISFTKKFSIINNLSSINKKKYDLIVNTTSIGFDSWVGSQKFENLKYFSPFSKLSSIKKINFKVGSNFVKLNKDLITHDTKKVDLFFSKNKKIDVFDIIYNPKKTKLLKYAKKYRNKIYNGLEMNLIQAVKAFMIVNNIKNFNSIKKKMI